MVLVSDEESPVDCSSMDVFPAAMIMSHLTAMKNGSAEARQRFPRLLQIVDYYPETIETFCEKVTLGVMSLLMCTLFRSFKVS